MDWFTLSFKNFSVIVAIKKIKSIKERTLALEYSIKKDKEMVKRELIGKKVF